MKYPFFLAGPAYTVYAGESLVAGYGRLGRGWVRLLWALEVFGGITSAAASCAFSAAIVRFIAPSIPMPAACALVMAAAVLVILCGRYRLLSAVLKTLVALLAFITVCAVLVYAGEALSANGAGAVLPALSPWTFASLGFIVMMTGWMPCPLDLSAIQSVWVTCQQRNEGVTARGLFFDFNLSYAATALLAVVFLALGVLMMHDSGQTPASNGAAFTAQLIGMYEAAVGGWSRPFMALMAFACIWDTTITVLDGYARVIGVCQQHIRGLPEDAPSSAFTVRVLVQAVLGLVLILFFKSEMLVLLQFAMISAFCTTPILAWLNYRLMTGPLVPAAKRYGPLMHLWSLAGLVFLFGFLTVFLIWLFRVQSRTAPPDAALNYLPISGPLSVLYSSGTGIAGISHAGRLPRRISASKAFKSPIRRF